MTIFRYEAVDKAGNVIRGAMDASDEQSVMQRLVTMGYTTRNVIPAPGSKVAKQSMPKASMQGAAGCPVSVQSVVPMRALSMFFRQLAITSKAGIPLFQALTDARPMIRNRKLNHAVGIMIDRTRNGSQLSASMAEFPHIFPVWATSLVWAGELGGFREIALSDVAIKLETQTREQRTTRFGWIIFKVNLIVLILSLPFLNIGAVMNSLMATGGQGGAFAIVWDQIRPPLVYGAIPACILLFIWWEVWGILKRKPNVRKVLDSLLLRVPIWGALSKERSISRFIKTLQTLYQTGVQPKQCWDAASLTAYNSEIAERLKMSGEILMQQKSLFDAFAQSGTLPIEEVGIVQAAEKAGQVPDTLEEMARAHDDAAENHIKRNGMLWSWGFQIISWTIFGGIPLIMFAKSWAGFFNGFLKELGM